MVYVVFNIWFYIRRGKKNYMVLALALSTFASRTHFKKSKDQNHIYFFYLALILISDSSHF